MRDQQSARADDQRWNGTGILLENHSWFAGLHLLWFAAVSSDALAWIQQYWKVKGILLLILSRRKVLNGLFELPFDIQSTDTTTNWNVEEGLLSKDEALLFETDATTNLNVAEVLSWLNWFVEVTGAHTNHAKVLDETLVVKVTISRASNVKMLHETFVDEVTGSHANNVKTLHETFFDKVTGSHDNNVKTVHETLFDEVTDSNPIWEWTQQ